MAAAAALLAALAGCSRGPARPKVAPLHGRVLYKGQPLAGYDVTFMCPGSPRYSYGVTDEEGHFTLTTFEPNDGAVVGENKVTVFKLVRPPRELGGDVPDPEVYMREMARVTKPPPHALPARYGDGDPNKSELTLTVVDGENTPLLELRD